MSLLKEIKGHNSAYLVGSNGAVLNIVTGKYLKPVKGTNGYYHVTLCYGKKEDRSVHRLVAEAFVPNPNNLPCVNHKDENKLNNNADNLEWCDAKYNVNYGIGALARNSPVVQKDIDGNIIKFWGSMKEASEALNIKYQGISSVCRGRNKTCGGYKWEYA